MIVIIPNGLVIIVLKFYFRVLIHLNFLFYMAGRNMEGSLCV
jgi:hypothetical protein